MSTTEMTEHQKKAFDFTNDLVKQILTISVAVITLAVGNLDRLASLDQPGWLGATFCLYAASIVFGLFALMSLSGKLDINHTNEANKKYREKNKARLLIKLNKERKKRNETQLPELPPLHIITASDLTVYDPGIRTFAFIHIISFGVAIILTIIFALMGMKNFSHLTEKKVTIFQVQANIDSSLLRNAEVDTIFYQFTPAVIIKEKQSPLVTCPKAPVQQPVNSDTLRK